VSAALQELVVYAAVLAASASLLLRWRRSKARACSACAPASTPATIRGVRARGLTILP